MMLVGGAVCTAVWNDGVVFIREGSMQSAKVRIQASGRPGRLSGPHLVGAVSVAVLGLGVASAAFAQIPSVLSGGPPVQVIPYVSEPGVPQVTITPGTANPFSGADGSGGSGTGGTDGSGGGTGGNVGSSDALTTMESTSWGLAAISNASALGVNPSALAATCVLESGCSQPAAGSGAQGVFQMYPAAFQEGLQTALAANPALASQIVQGSAGMNDPTTEAVAASGYLMQAAQSLQNAGIADPTVVQARGYYNFGPSNGVQLATASPDTLMSAAMPSVPQGTLAANGVTPGMTVGQWQAAVAAKIGSAANQSVLT
jgi:hypothetical protein